MRKEPRGEGARVRCKNGQLAIVVALESGLIIDGQDLSRYTLRLEDGEMWYNAPGYLLSDVE